MALITIDQARSQVRVESDYPDEQLQPAIDGATDAAQAFLNRKVYETDAQLQEERSQLVARVAAAGLAKQAAVDAAAALSSDEERRCALQLAEVQYVEAKDAASKCINGIVVNSSIRSAILLLVGHLFSNRETVVIGQSVADIPMGAQSLLRPYRIVQMP